MATQVYAATLQGSSWSALVRLPLDQVVGKMSLAFVDANSLLLTWSEGRSPDRRDTLGARAPISRYAWWRQECRDAPHR
jgi:hypothetical protein